MGAEGWKISRGIDEDCFSSCTFPFVFCFLSESVAFFASYLRLVGQRTFDIAT